MAQLREVLAQATETLKSTGITETPFLDALLLASKVLQTSKEKALASMERELSYGQQREFHNLLALRSSGTPSAYLMGQQEFYGYLFTVTPDVLIPRPESELLVEETLHAAGELPSGIRILDLCTGSGCIGISLKLQLKNAEVICSDVSERALAVCRENARNLRADVSAVHSSLFENLSGPFSIVVSNPPYLTSLEMEDPQLKSRDEPELALRGGPDGLDIIREIVCRGYDVLIPGGFLILESSIDQTEAVRTMMLHRGYSEARISADLTGRGRVVTGRL